MKWETKQKRTSVQQKLNKRSNSVAKKFNKEMDRLGKRLELVVSGSGNKCASCGSLLSCCGYSITCEGSKS